MKSYTGLEQSKKLSEILPLESADMHWQYIEEDNGQLQWFCFSKDFSINQHDKVSAWSLTALLEVLPEPSLIQNQEGLWMLRIWDKERFPFSIGGHTNPIDACYEMILKLHEPLF